jgi:hypothetical protein
MRLATTHRQKTHKWTLFDICREISKWSPEKKSFSSDLVINQKYNFDQKQVLGKYSNHKQKNTANFVGRSQEQTDVSSDTTREPSATGNSKIRKKSSFKGHTVDALVLNGDEGRDKLR